MDKKTIKRLLTYCKPYRFLIVLLTLLSIVSVVFTLLTPVLIGQAIDLLVGKNQVHFQALLNKLIFIGIDVWMFLSINIFVITGLEFIDMEK